MHFHRDVSNLTVMPENAAKKHIEARNRNIFHKTVTNESEACS
jgi:hypothetical protein